MVSYFIKFKIIYCMSQSLKAYIHNAMTEYTMAKNTHEIENKIGGITGEQEEG